jgi:hypothetical protein
MHIIIPVICMNLLNVKLELKLNEYLYTNGKITQSDYELAKSVLINRLTTVSENDKINYEINSNREMINNEIT